MYLYGQQRAVHLSCCGYKFDTPEQHRTNHESNLADPESLVQPELDSLCNNIRMVGIIMKIFVCYCYYALLSTLKYFNFVPV